MNNILETIKRLKPDYSNIDEVYNDRLHLFSTANPDKSEVEFINFETELFCNYNFESEELIKSVMVYSEYTAKKIIRTKWTLNDYYNRYIKTGQFTNKPSKHPYKSNEFKKVVDQFKEYKTQYDYIFTKLSIENRIKFKNDFCDHLIIAERNQTFGAFKEIIKDLIEQLNKEYLESKTVQPQQPKVSKQKKELFDFIYNVTEKESFISELIKTFKTEIGIDFRIIIEQLKENEILIIGNRENKLFVEVAGVAFKRNIGSVQSINDNFKNTIKDKENYSENIKTIVEKLKPLIANYKQN